MSIKDVLKKLINHRVEICYYVPETAIFECDEGVLLKTNDNYLVLKQLNGSTVYMSNIIIYRITDYGEGVR